MLSNRQKLILKAITEYYIENGHAMGSDKLTEQPYLDFSSATLRSDMAELEKLGYLSKLHQSGGRIPTDLGYKYYVENLVIRDNDIKEYLPMVDKILEENKHQKISAVENVTKWLSEASDAAVVQIGSEAKKLIVKKIDLIPITNTTGVLIIVTEDGHVQSESITMPSGISVNNFNQVIKKFDEVLTGKTIENAMVILKDEGFNKKMNILINYSEAILNIFLVAFSKFIEENVQFKGIAKLLQNDSIDPQIFLQEYEKKLKDSNFIKLVSDDSGLSLRLGEEITFLPQSNCSILSIPYKINEEQKGAIAVIGPKRMNYKKIIPLLEYVGLRITQLFNDDYYDKEE